jgi:Arc/MetJ-type ribon-helix-helix transcriptional regulator
MSAAKIAVSLDPDALKEVDRLVEGGAFPSRSRLIQDALAEKLERLRRVRLARECAKLDKDAERSAAEEFLPSEARWPEY